MLRAAESVGLTFRGVEMCEMESGESKDLVEKIGETEGDLGDDVSEDEVCGGGHGEGSVRVGDVVVHELEIFDPGVGSYRR